MANSSRNIRKHQNIPTETQCEYVNVSNSPLSPPFIEWGEEGGLGSSERVKIRKK